MKTNIFGFQSTGFTASTDRFMEFMGQGHGAQTNTGQSTSVVPCAGTISNLYVSQEVASGGGLSRTFELYKNGANTGLVVTITDPATTGSDLNPAHAVSVVAGDLLTLRTSASGTTANFVSLRWGALFEAATSISPVCANPLAAFSNSATNYHPLMGSKTPDTVTASSAQIMPCAGTIKNLYLVTAAPGVGTDFTVTLVVNGVDSALVAVVSGTNTTGNDLTHSVSVAAGDSVYYKVVPSVVPPTARFVMAGVEFDPTVDGEAPLLHNNTTNAATAAVRFDVPSGNIIGALSSTEPNRQEYIANAAVLKKLYVLLSAAPGAAKSYQTQVSVNTTPGNPSVTITGAGTTTGNDLSNTVNVAAGDLISMKVTPAGSPTAAALSYSLVSYIAPIGARSYGYVY